MNEHVTWGPVSASWAAVGAVAAIAGVVVAIVIAVIVQRASSRNAREMRSLVTSVNDLVRRSRLDEVLAQLRTSRDIDRLRLNVAEGRELVRRVGAERVAVEKAYFTNPAVPLLRFRHEFPRGLSVGTRRDVLNAVLTGLPDRYPDGIQQGPSVKTLAHLTRIALDTNADSYLIAQFLVARATAGSVVVDLDVRSILFPPLGYACAPNVEAAGDYLFQLVSARPPRSGVVNIVAGVALAVLDAHERSAVRPQLGSALTGFVMVMQRTLAGIGEVGDEPGMSISVDHAVAVVAHAVGVCAAQGDEHLAMRAIEALSRVLASFPSGRFTSVGVVAEHLRSGADLLVARYPGRPVTVRLTEEVERLLGDA